MIKKTTALLSIFICFSLEATRQKFQKLPLTAQKAKNIIDDIYTKIDQSPYNIESKEVEMIRKQGGDSTYGEITYESTNQLIDHAKFTAQNTFYDFGCGRGKACMQVALQTNAHVVGIDLSETRISIANRAKEMLKKLYHIDLGKRCVYRKESFIETPLKQNVIIYACATCFSEELMKEIGKKIDGVESGIRLYTLKQIPGKESNETLTWSMSWSPSSTCYFYDTRKKL